MGKMTKALEDYLEAILMLGGTVEQSVRPSDIARKMGVSKTSAGKALGTLRENGLITQPYYGEATFTQTGFEYASGVYKRHRYLTAFLAQEVGLAPETAEEEACLMEHAISDDSFAKWAAYIEARCDIEA